MKANGNLENKIRIQVKVSTLRDFKGNVKYFYFQFLNVLKKGASFNLYSHFQNYVLKNA